jgi:hypothetical protein
MANSFQFVKNKILNFPNTYIRVENQSHFQIICDR